MWTNTLEFGKVLESMFGATEFPKIIVQSKIGDKKNFIYDGELTKEGITDYVKKVKSGEMDGTLNDSPIDSLSWTGFPTLYYIKAGNSEPMKYEGPRDAKGIWKWLKKNHSQAELIKEKIAAKVAAKADAGDAV